LTPPDAGILRILASEPEITQRALADRLGVYASRLVLLLDDMVMRSLVERHPSPNDRRSHVVRLTTQGEAQLAAIARVAREHQEDLCASLGAADRDQLRDLLERIAEQQQLRPGVHPGYRRLNRRPGKAGARRWPQSAKKS
jgi:DNA-binding MarR family transcriptional regulator